MNEHTNKTTNEYKDDTNPVCLVIVLTVLACQLVALGAALGYLIDAPIGLLMWG